MQPLHFCRTCDVPRQTISRHVRLDNVAGVRLVLKHGGHSAAQVRDARGDVAAAGVKGADLAGGEVDEEDRSGDDEAGDWSAGLVGAPILGLKIALALLLEIRG